MKVLNIILYGISITFFAVVIYLFVVDLVILFRLGLFISAILFIFSLITENIILRKQFKKKIKEINLLRQENEQ
ncbi:MAG: hypothetical protein LBV69_00205 [Bacteroidales bacterium]|jgi:hypothetical protein|nr:hypothetical protein [Bacteroidales bacterium]